MNTASDSPILSCQDATTLCATVRWLTAWIAVRAKICRWQGTKLRQGAVFAEFAPAHHTYCMKTFWQWLAEIRLLETYYGLDPKQYNSLFDMELEKVIGRVKDPAHRQALEGMRGFGWMGYIAAAVRNGGFHDQREIQERAHDIAVKLLVGGLFRDYDERRHGPMDLRFKRSVGNAIRNMVEKERNRRRLLPTVPIQQEFEPGMVTADDLPARSPQDDGEKVVRDFRRLVKRRLGEIGGAVLDTRLAGEETKGLVGRPDLGSPGRFVVKRVVCQIKELAREYAVSLDDPELLRRVARAMGREEETVAKRRTATAARMRQGVGA